MRKLLLSTVATLLIGVAVVNAGDRKFGAPRNQNGSIAETSDYAGVSASTVTLSSANAQLFTGEGVVYGFIASSNTSVNDFVSFRLSTGIHDNKVDAGGPDNGDYNTTNEFARVYLSTGPSLIGTASTSGMDGQIGTSYKFPMPIYIRNGCAAKANVATINIITFLYHKFGQTGNGANELP